MCLVSDLQCLLRARVDRLHHSSAEPTALKRRDALDRRAGRRCDHILQLARMLSGLQDHLCGAKDRLGGTTMEAVRVLEEKGFRSAVIEAEKACVSKSRSM